MEHESSYVRSFRHARRKHFSSKHSRQSAWIGSIRSMEGENMIESPICSLLGIDYPVFQGGMAWISDGRLAAAVSEAGGLGIIAAGSAPASYVKAEIEIARQLTDRPFGVNIMLMSPYAGEIAELVAREKVSVVTTGAGNPSRYMDMWKKAGVHVIPVVASVALAKMMTRLGASALIAEGGESGGHIGELSTMVLVPMVVDATDLPVIAAGGIADGRGFAAALMLGACGIQMGTRFLAAQECRIHPEYKNRIVKAGDRCTLVTGRRLGHPVRSLKTSFSREYLEKEYGGASEEELEKMGSDALRKAVVDSDVDGGCFLSGQIAGMVSRIEPAAEIVKDVVEDAERILASASTYAMAKTCR